MGDQAHDFFRASGALTVVEYKAVIEALLRSSKSAGFQLLSLNDFPGQGYAPVGVLDPFWDSKGLVTPEDWRAFCAPTVALLRYPKSAWFEDETFTAKAEVYNFGAAVLRAVGDTRRPLYFLMVDHRRQRESHRQGQSEIADRRHRRRVPRRGVLRSARQGARPAEADRAPERR